MVRNQLVDLYFSQTVHLSYPMLVSFPRFQWEIRSSLIVGASTQDKARFFRWSAQLPVDSGSSRLPTITPELYLAGE